ncbi:hypothetical protein L596_030928 [Steinernema carpocapsae]|uniref:Uncharacterized protein n=1 Tax=Steinernema carpocapsae TaxID=34508 RepID=A0A4U5MHD1_STECR|nr:hypothetical protein L596_030928 [Steinernema carpocapsae]
MRPPEMIISRQLCSLWSNPDIKFHAYEPKYIQNATKQRLVMINVKQNGDQNTHKNRQLRSRTPHTFPSKQTNLPHLNTRRSSPRFLPQKASSALGYK